MAEKSGISWTKSTFNPWIGCTKVGPGCDHCYAEELDKQRLSKTLGGGTKEIPIIHWGVGAPRYRTSASNWNGPLKWNRQAQASGEFWPVFCASLADVGDHEVPDGWRRDLWRLIYDTPYLTWLLVTKRIGNLAKMLPWYQPAPDRMWGPAWRNVWILATMVNQDEFDRDWPKLRAIPATVRGLSVEPMLGPITFPEDVRGELHWVIYGGESEQGGAAARLCKLEWIYDGISQCRRYGVAPFVKQLGHNATVNGQRPRFTGKGADQEEWPEGLDVQEFPR